MNANIISGSEQIGNIWRSRQRPAGRLWQTRINIQLLRFVANNSISMQTYTPHSLHYVLWKECWHFLSTRSISFLINFTGKTAIPIQLKGIRNDDTLQTHNDQILQIIMAFNPVEPDDVFGRGILACARFDTYNFNWADNQIRNSVNRLERHNCHIQNSPFQFVVIALRTRFLIIYSINGLYDAIKNFPLPSQPARLSRSCTKLRKWNYISGVKWFAFFYWSVSYSHAHTAHTAHIHTLTSLISTNSITEYCGCGHIMGLFA